MPVQFLLAFRYVLVRFNPFFFGLKFREAGRWTLDMQQAFHMSFKCTSISTTAHTKEMMLHISKASFEFLTKWSPSSNETMAFLYS